MYRRTTLLAAGLALMLIGCEPEPDPSPALPDPEETAAQDPVQTAPQAHAMLRDAQGRDLGHATFRQEGDAVVIEVSVAGLPPGERAIHVHAVGVCEPPDFQSAGDHFITGDRAHGFEHPDGPHAGDLENLLVGADGTAQQTFRNDRISLVGGTPGYLLAGEGAALVIHAAADDYVSQPSGDAGARLACGVIG